MSDSDLAYIGASDALRMFRSGQLSHVELLEAQLARIAASAGSLNAVCFTYADEAMEKARRAEARYAARASDLGPLEGIMTALKDENMMAGKITTYRRLAESMLGKIEGFLGKRGAQWTADAPLPGGDFPQDGFEAEVKRLAADYPFLEASLARRLVRLYGTLARTLLGEAKTLADLGRDFGAGLYEAEVRYLIDREWARTAEDVLWRRTKRGLHFDDGQAAALENFMRGQGR